MLSRCWNMASKILALTLALLPELGLASQASEAPECSSAIDALPLQRALTVLRQESILPCDTWVALPDATADGTTILAKNSDRTVFDCQPLLLHPRRSWDEGSTIDLGRTQVPQVAETFATLGSSPYWCWGYEEGINEFGVAIGNEGIFTRARSAEVAAASRGDGPPLGPTGMDLLRLALERSRTAEEAVRTIGQLLERHGQFGSGMPMQPAVLGAYDNSFIVADPNEAWVLETCGRLWVARRQKQGTTSISNVPSIGREWDLACDDLVSRIVEQGWWPADQIEAFDFTAASLDPNPQLAAQAQRARTRASCSAGLLAEKAGSVDPGWMMRIARDRSTTPSLDLDVTASSCVAVLPREEGAIPVFWWCAGTPSNGCFVPFFVHGSELSTQLSQAGTVGRKITPPSQVARDEFSEQSYWWLFRDLCDLVRMDYAERNAIVRAAFDPLEAEFEHGLSAVLEQAARLRAMEIEVPAAYRPFVGRYEARIGGQDVVIEILVQSDRLAAQLPDGRVFELLEPDAEGRWFFALTDQASVSFELDDAGSAASMELHQAGASFRLAREVAGADSR